MGRTLHVHPSRTTLEASLLPTLGFEVTLYDQVQSVLTWLHFARVLLAYAYEGLEGVLTPQSCLQNLEVAYTQHLLRLSARLLAPPVFRFPTVIIEQTEVVGSGSSISASKMEPPFPHILNPQISGSSFGSMLDSRDPVPPPQESITSATDDLYRDTATNGSRKRPATRIKSTYPRKRAIQACQKCRARRTKCNNVRPACSSCLDLGVDCSYAETDPSRYVRFSQSLRGLCVSFSVVDYRKAMMQPALPFSRSSPLLSNFCERTLASHRAWLHRLTMSPRIRRQVPMSSP